MAALAAALVLAAGGGMVGAWLVLRPGPPLDPPVELSIPPGTPLRAIARELAHRGVLRHPLPLLLWARLSGRDRAVRWGDYSFAGRLTPFAVLERLTGPPDPEQAVTIPEGLTVREVVTLLAASGFAPEERFHAVLADPAFLASEGVPAVGAEGYLFPDTYLLPRTTPPDQVLRTMIRRFHRVFGPELRERATALGLTVHEAVTLASLVEEETARPEERPLVAAVFLNRLRRGMPLQSDPTVLYGRADNDRSIDRDDLARPTPHNTYTSRGLPPTPIANPGRAALEAAVTPADVPYLYFVARGDGSHEFSADLAAHQAAVARWRRRAPPAGESPPPRRSSTATGPKRPLRAASRARRSPSSAAPARASAPQDS